MARKATKADLEGALAQLQGYIPDELELEQWGQKFRVIRADNSRPFGSSFRTKDSLYETLWFAVNALRLARDGQWGAISEVLNIANDIQGLSYDNSPKDHENDIPAHRLGLAIFAAGEIKRAAHKLS